MPVVKYGQMQMTDLQAPDMKDVAKAVVINKNEGWEDYTLRVFRLKPGGYTPRHSHAWEHVNYVIQGTGKLRLGDKVTGIAAKDFAFVPPHVEHQFENDGTEDLEFICIVPNRGEY